MSVLPCIQFVERGVALNILQARNALLHPSYGEVIVRAPSAAVFHIPIFDHDVVHFFS